jgi:hypothetical protein
LRFLTDALICLAILALVMDGFVYLLTGESAHHAMMHKGWHEKIGCPSSTSDNSVSCSD